MAAELDHRSLYRLPWSVSDNVIAWMEPTAKCNLACEGCYRENVNQHKSLEQVRNELEVFKRWRTFDGVSIAGGDPLLHPQIVEIVRMVAKDGHKPVLNTNGHALTEDLLRALKKAGLVGLTFHVDSKQGRPGWKNKNELDLNALRLEYAQRVAEVGGLSCAFNATVYEDTLQYVPDLVQFGADHIDLVDVMVFICFRAALTNGCWDYYRNGKKLEISNLKYSSEEGKHRIDIGAREVVAKIQERFPDFMPDAYLGGTEKPNSFKWLHAGRIGLPGKPGRIFGYTGPKFMELSQTVHHAATGRYLAYAPRKSMEMGRSLLALAPLDKGIRGILRNYLGYLRQHPLEARRKLHFQSIMTIQPIDVLPDGRQNMCDGCPDMTVHNGELVWSCRLDEQLKYGGWIQTVPRKDDGQK